VTTRSKLRAATVVVLAGLVAAAAITVIHHTFLRSRTITAYFTAAVGIYRGDEVRVSGVKVGTITSIEPQGTQAKLTLAVDRDVPIPADAKAVIAAQNLVSARYVQLAPTYRDSGPTMGDNALIPLERTAIPVEWDEVKDQLNRLATDLGPTTAGSTTSVGRFIDSAADALKGNGDKLRQTIAQLSGVGRVLAQGSGNIADIIKNLQIFVGALRDSGTQLVQFEDRLATLSSVVDNSDSSLDAALKDLSETVSDVKQFIAVSRDATAEQIQRLGDVTQNLVNQRMSLKNILHVAPNVLANGYNVYNPDTGNPRGVFVLPGFANPVQFICGAIGAIKNTTAPETAKLCGEYLGPALRLLNLNYLPMPTNLYLAKSASPENIIYSDPQLAPGGGGTHPSPPEIPPVVSAYTGLNGDVPPPAGWGPPSQSAPGSRLPAVPSPALFPGAPVPSTPPTLDDLMLPTQRPTHATSPPVGGPAGPPLPAEGTPSS